MYLILSESNFTEKNVIYLFSLHVLKKVEQKYKLQHLQVQLRIN